MIENPRRSERPAEPTYADPDSTDMVAKQVMLRDELLEQGYDGEEFVKYIEGDVAVKHLADWTLSELRHVDWCKLESNRVQSCQAARKWRS